MALLSYQAPVDYAAQLDAFKDFLNHFKTLQSSSEAAATEAMEELNIDGNRTSDEYDFMDDVNDEEGAETGRTRRRREPKLKYMQILQDIANRDISNILIELDDLEVVSLLKYESSYAVAHTTTLQFEKALPDDQQSLNLVESIQKNTKRYIDVFSQAVDAVMPKETKDVTYVICRDVHVAMEKYCD